MDEGDGLELYRVVDNAGEIFYIAGSSILQVVDAFSKQFPQSIIQNAELISTNLLFVKGDFE